MLLSAAFHSALVIARQRDNRSLQLLFNTNLKVEVPSDWTSATTYPLSRLSAGPPQLEHIGKPVYQLTIWQTISRTERHACVNLVGSMNAVPTLGATISPRPAFIPDVYFGSILEIPKAQLTCLDAGDGEVAVLIHLLDGDPRPDVLTTMLGKIADAAIRQSAAVSSPGRLKLRSLGVEIPVRSGAWGVRVLSETFGKNDVLGRMAQPGGNELFITPFILPTSPCQLLIKKIPIPSIHATFVSDRRYGGSRWDPDALEQFPPPFKGLQAYVCRNVGTNSVLIARIEYEKSAIDEVDRPVLRQILDDIGDAVDEKLNK
jgi:hypothetical protein